MAIVAVYKIPTIKYLHITGSGLPRNKIAGIVDINTIPGQARVTLLNRNTMQVIGSKVSKPDGTFQFDNIFALSDPQSIMVIADNTDITNTGVVADHITATLV